MIEGEEALVLLAHVVHSEVDRRTVGSRSKHHIQHDFRYIYPLASREWSSLISLVLMGRILCGVLRLFFVKEHSDSVLPPEFSPGLL